MILKRIFFGLLLIGGGFLLVKDSRKLVGWFGRSATVERYLGQGGTSTFYKLFGILMILAGFIYMFNLLPKIAGR